MITLAGAPLGVPLTIADTGVTGPAGKRLAMMGVRPGALVTVMLRTSGGGRVLDVAGARLAVGRDLLGRLSVEEA